MDFHKESDYLEIYANALSTREIEDNDFVRNTFSGVYENKEKIDALPIINDPPKRNILTFILFVIPGTPKDLFTYAIGLTDMSIPLYIALTTAARFPSVVLSTLSGGALGTKDYSLAVIFVIVTAVVSGVGLLVYRGIVKRRRK